MLPAGLRHLAQYRRSIGVTKVAHAQVKVGRGSQTWCTFQTARHFCNCHNTARDLEDGRFRVSFIPAHDVTRQTTTNPHAYATRAKAVVVVSGCTRAQYDGTLGQSPLSGSCRSVSR